MRLKVSDSEGVRAVVIGGDSLVVLPKLPDAYFDSIVTDPPYELGFMGKKWDGTGIAYNVDLWRECLRVLKPGGHLLSFGGSRTFHRVAVAIEDAGFEIRDTIMWTYGTGFPKSMDVSKAIDKAAGAEREVVGRRTDGRYAYEFKGTANRPTGAASGSMDAERIGGFVSDKAIITAPSSDEAKQWQGWGTALKPAMEPIIVARKSLSEKTVAANVIKYGTGAINIDGSRMNQPNPSGRWPANVILEHSEHCHDQCIADCPVKIMDEQSGEAGGQGPASGPTFSGEHKSDSMAGAFKGNGDAPPKFHNDSGGASRFFYQAKATKKERPSYIDAEGNKIVHPTVKSLALMRYLVKLVTPPGGLVLDHFGGSGTTAEAALLDGFRSVSVEQFAPYCELIKIRLSKHDHFIFKES